MTHYRWLTPWTPCPSLTSPPPPPLPAEVELDQHPRPPWARSSGCGPGCVAATRATMAPGGLFRIDADEGTDGRPPNGATCQPPFPARSKSQAHWFHGLAGSSSRC